MSSFSSQILASTVWKENCAFRGRHHDSSKLGFWKLAAKSLASKWLRDMHTCTCTYTSVGTTCIAALKPSWFKPLILGILWITWPVLVATCLYMPHFLHWHQHQCADLGSTSDNVPKQHPYLLRLFSFRYPVTPCHGRTQQEKRQTKCTFPNSIDVSANQLLWVHAVKVYLSTRNSNAACSLPST